MAQAWDFIMIVVIWFYAFYIPFHFGISGGYYTIFNQGFLIFICITNSMFVVDTVLAFFRAYRDKNGLIVYSLKTIGRRYISSGWFFINLLASLPASMLIYREAKAHIDSGRDGEVFDNTQMKIFFALELFKLLRLLRIKKIMQTSEVMSRFWERINVQIALTTKFFFMIILVSHWIACIWGTIAFQQAGTFSYRMLDSINWISNWYESSYIEGGLNPIGWDNAIPRYWLCLFWAIQSITSIGYGNIAPVTTIEFGFANFLMLMCGIFWAYIIGSLVEVVQSMGSLSQEYISRMNEANQMVKDFTVKELPESVAGATYARSSKRVRRFITNQRDVATKHALGAGTTTLDESYPTLSILSPELRRVCVLHLTHSLLETIPYLSSKYLSPEEQADIALQCVTLEFSSAEKFVSHPNLGRGILIFRRGFATVSRNIISHNFLRWQKDLIDQPINVDEVLVEDDYFRERQLVFHFVGFTKAFFVPRSAIMGVLEKNERAWKECARWRYFTAALVLFSMKHSPKALKAFMIVYDTVLESHDNVK
eukprot:CAMPEP_0172545316 /NCGR_PEP_ID=MMETSP1067-20121228/15255_1 /TAXON_ID=265564 ORGANISM="Thalassiosira punctigera, Strain Tpunct2005C2" /NCGR_SAMPLE_ID=MMETSP1067 /ASSEMBLY_ACC=CAM_ASM_000444 /LENGTH=538 /DNA_ID=CAMNT_0013332031 /DNA_START=233 /DNA_END=1850 /DNA_ORIENTATION=-